MRLRWMIFGCVLVPSMVLPASAQWIDSKTFPAPTDARPAFGIAGGPDGALWFTDGSNRIGRITTAGAVTMYPLPTDCGSGGCRPAGIVAGPDGALWFAESAGEGKIGRITTAGVITEYPVFCCPTSIAVGPDGAFWFTEFRGSIGRMTVGGAFTEYSLPTNCGNPFQGCGVAGIAAGLDAMWFTETFPGKIGRITMNGAITEYPLPAGVAPVMIAKSWDGAFWFTNSANPTVGRITTSGLVTQYPASFYAGGITAGPDGALWLTQVVGNRIGRITTTGVFTDYPVPLIFDESFAIAPGPGGTLWFVGRNRIGRVPACGLGLRAGFANTTLLMNFTLGIPTSATWSAGFYSTPPAGLNGMWSIPIPRAVNQVSFPVFVGPGFPSLGNIGIVSTIKDPATGKFQCAEWQIVYTGGSGASEADLQNRILEGLSNQESSRTP